MTARRGRPPKARLEGEAVVLASQDRIADPVPGDNGKALERITEYFKARFPDEWEAMRLCPFQHGLVDMARLLKG